MLRVSVKRLFDIATAVACILLLGPVMLVVALAVRVTSRGPVIHWSKRVGRNNVLFDMPKFRTMFTGTPQLATHLLSDSASHITPVGSILRKTSLDELPQLWSVLLGEMSFVGPRPALYNQHDLVAARTSCMTHQLVPGITGWAQINGRDELSIDEKVEFDAEYLQRQSLWFDVKIVALTMVKVFRSDGVCQADSTTNIPTPEVFKRAA